MKCNQIDMGAGTVLRIAGVLDAASACELMPIASALIAGGRRLVVIDLSSLRLIDRFGARALVSLCQQMRQAGGTVRVIGLSEQPLAMLQLLRLHHHLCASSSEELAAVA